MTPEDDHLLAKLEEDLGSAADARALLPIIGQISRPVAPPSLAGTQALVERLKRDMPQRRHRWHDRQALLLSQFRIIQRDLWLASFMLMALGLVLTLTQADSLLFAMIAPFVAAGGVAFLYNEMDASLEELENSTPTPAALLLLTRLMLLFVFDLGLALACSVVLAIILPNVSLIPLIEAWFAPMAFLSCLAFFLSVVLLDTFAALLFSLTLWAVHLLLRTRSAGQFWLWLASLPGLSAPEMRPLLLLSAAMLLFGALVFQAERTHRAGS